MITTEELFGKKKLITTEELFGTPSPTPMGDLIEKGNIDLSSIKPITNHDGTVSTVRSITVESDGVYLVLPTIASDGHVMDMQESFEVYKQTGKHLGKYKTQEAADSAAWDIHLAEEKRVTTPSTSIGDLPQLGKVEDTEYPVDTRTKDVRNALIESLMKYGFNTGKGMATLGERFTAEMTEESARELEKLHELPEGSITPEVLSAINEKYAPARQYFAGLYDSLKKKDAEFFKNHPELAPRAEWEGSVIENIKKNPKLLIDPYYWAYLSASSIAPTLAAIGTTLAATAIAGPAAGAIVGAISLIPSSVQDVREELEANGATREQALYLAPIAGTIIAGVEELGDLPLLGAVSKPFRNILHKNITSAVTKHLITKAAGTMGKIVVSETMEEDLQLLISNTVIRTVNENRGLLEGLAETTIQSAMAALSTGLAGGGANIVTDTQQQIQQKMATAQQNAQKVAQENKGGAFNAIEGETITQEEANAPVEQMTPAAAYKGVKDEEFYPAALDLFKKNPKITATDLRKELKIGAARANRILEKVQGTREEGIILSTGEEKFREDKLLGKYKKTRPPEEIPDYIYRHEDVTVKERATTKKPHGIYGTPWWVLHSFHADELKGGKYWWKVNKNANILYLPDEKKMLHTGRDEMAVPASAGMRAYVMFHGEEGLKIEVEKGTAKVREELKQRYPEVDWDLYNDVQEMLEGVAGLEAREKGYDAMWAPDLETEAFDEFVGLTDNALTPIEEAPVFEKEKVENVQKMNTPPSQPEGTTATIETPNQTQEGVFSPKPVTSTGKELLMGAVDNIAAALNMEYAGNPIYNEAQNKEQARRAVDMISTPEGYRKALDILFGKAPMSDEVLTSALLSAVSYKANLENDFELASQLSKSPVVKMIYTRFGQETQALKLLDPGSPVLVLYGLNQTGEKTFQAIHKGKSMEEVKNEMSTAFDEEMKKATPDESAWRTFINQITC